MSTTEDAAAHIGRPPAHLVAHLDEIISVVAPDGTVLSVNHSTALPRDQSPPTSALTWVHPDDVHIVSEAFCTLLADPDAQTRTLVRVRQPGQPYRHMETTGINRIDDPDVGGLIFVSRDVEERVQLASAVQRSLEAQRLAAELGVRLLAQAQLGQVLPQALAQTASLLGATYLTLHERHDDGELRVTLMHGPRPLTPGHLPSTLGPRARENVSRGVVRTAEARLAGPQGTLGVLVAGWTEHEPVFDEVQRQLLQGVADVLAAARQREHRETEAVVRALHDPLTGLPTRPLLLDRLDQALRRSERDGGEVAVLLIDLDRFKEVNDRFGHAAGDAVLAELGARLAQHVRPGDTAARYGGDEFVVLCPDVPSMPVALDLIDRVRTVFLTPFTLPGEADGSLMLSGSVGAAFSGSGGLDRAGLLREADQAMYRDKRSSG